MAFQYAPAWVENSDEHHAVIYRTMLASVVGGASGVANAAALRVTERDGTADMSVDVAAGGAFIPSTRSVHQGTYHGYNDSTINVPITASHPTNDRIDRILVRVRDEAQDVALTENDITLHVIEGTPASVPTPPPVDVDDWIELARVRVPAGGSSITDGDITDVRQMVADQGSGTRLIQEVVLGSSGPELNITGIDQTFRDLRLIVWARGASGTEATLRMRFNGVTTSTYRTVVTQNQAGTIASSTADDDSWRIGDVSDTTNTNWTQAIVDIAEYVDGLRPTPTFTSMARRAGGNDRFVQGGLLTLDSATSPVSSISVFMNVGQLQAGSKLRLYGIR